MFYHTFLTFIAICLYFVVCNRKFGPLYPPSKGEVWPKPRYQTTSDFYYVINPHTLNFTVIGKKCTILANALKRYSFVLRNYEGLRKKNDKWNLRLRRKSDKVNQGDVLRVTINIVVSCEEYPYLGMDESYFLKVDNTIQLMSNTIWGMLHGLETLVQLIHISDDKLEIIIKKTEIRDEPRYPHRGLLIDTSRHYISLFNILKTLDALAMNKMNVLHWHIVDDQSFPYQSENLPNLSYYGAYHRSLVYTKFDIKAVVNYARNRGIRVIPEFDVPSHARSWGQAYPKIMSDCHSGGMFTGYGPLDPTSNDTYKLLEELFTEVQEWFPDKYFHLGGDEVQFSCWVSDPAIQAYMQAHRVRSVKMLYARFMVKAFTILGRRSIPIVWQEVFDEKVPLARDTIVQVWRYGAAKTMMNILSAGYRAIYSSGWYLDQASTQGEWEQFYCDDPRRLVQEIANGGARNINLEKIVGGEACMWGELVNDNNIMSRVWPQTCAVAERLWSPKFSCGKKNRVPGEVYARIEEHTCRMNSRGVPAQPPSGPGFCIGV